MNHLCMEKVAFRMLTSSGRRIPNHLGALPGIHRGKIFRHRRRMMINGMHCQLVRGISCIRLSTDHLPIAVSVLHRPESEYDDSVDRRARDLLYEGQKGGLFSGFGPAAGSKFNRGLLHTFLWGLENVEFRRSQREPGVVFVVPSPMLEESSSSLRLRPRRQPRPSELHVRVIVSKKGSPLTSTGGCTASRGSSTTLLRIKSSSGSFPLLRSRPAAAAAPVLISLLLFFFAF